FLRVAMDEGVLAGAAVRAPRASRGRFSGGPVLPLAIKRAARRSLIHRDSRTRTCNGPPVSGPGRWPPYRSRPCSMGSVGSAGRGPAPAWPLSSAACWLSRRWSCSLPSPPARAAPAVCVWLRDLKSAGPRRRAAGLNAGVAPSVPPLWCSGCSGDPSQEPPGRGTRGPTRRVGTPLARLDEARVDELHALEVGPDLLMAPRHHRLRHPAEQLFPLRHGVGRLMVSRDVANGEVAARRDRRSEAGRDRPRVVAVGDEVQETHEQNRHRLLEIDQLLQPGIAEDVVRLADVALDHD